MYGLGSGWVSDWVESCQITKKLINLDLMDIRDELKAEIAQQSHPQSTSNPTNKDPAQAEAAHTECAADMETR